MPLNPDVLAANIKALLTSLPMGNGIVSASVSGASGPDGTITTTCVPKPGPIMMDPAMADTIAKAVATAVVTHITTMALVDITTGMIK